MTTSTDQHEHREAVAIVGLSCRFPGAGDPAEFWRLLQEGGDAVRPIPTARWQMTGSEPQQVWSAGLLENIEAFDPEFFGISLNEARQMDPQQRLLLEVSWEALEFAGYSREALAGSATGVFVGISTFDYSRFRVAPAAHSGTGNALSISANRISYFLDLRGPSMAVDTACSSSLTAVHLAVESLRRHEVNLSLVGGVNAILSPEIMVVLEAAGMLAADGRCKTFDSRADGYVRGEGCGVVVLKRLADAERDGDRVLAVIRGTAVNQDGKSNGLTAPSGPAQEALIAAALKDAGLTASDLDYIEAHGTGTSLGDPIEAMALNAALADGKSRTQPCLIGSVKTNIGHLEAAAGIAALIKTTLALHHGVIPASLHYREANPQIPFEQMALRVANKATPWPNSGRLGLAGISSFGFGGANAHVILEATGASVPNDVPAAADEPALIAMSAHSEPALRARLRDFQAWLGSESRYSLGDLGFASTVRRSHFKHRWNMVAPDREALLRGVASTLEGRTSPGVLTGVRHPGGPPPLVFVYSGQGADSAGMGMALYLGFPSFRAKLEECDAAAQAAGGPSLLQELLSAEDQGCTQPAQVALQISLTALLAEIGIFPDAVTGHSLGEIAAAWAAGVFSLEDTMRLAVRRQNAMASQRGNGGMVSVHASPEAVASLLGAWHPEAGIAAINGPASTVVFSSMEARDRVIADFESAGLECQRVRADSPFHSPHMEEARKELAHGLSSLQPQAERVPYYSTWLGRRASGEQLTADYWGRQLRDPVKFADAVTALAGDYPGATFLEIGGHPVLAAAMDQCLSAVAGEFRILPTLRRQMPESECLLRTLSYLYVEGRTLRWDRVYTRAVNRWVDLPRYPWQHKQCWAMPTPEVKVTLPPPVAEPETRVAAQTGRNDILRELRISVANILGSAPEEVDTHGRFIEMGADSILLAMAAQRIQQRYGVRIRIRQFFEELGDIEALADYLASHATMNRPSTPAAAPEAPKRAVADDSVQALLNRQLDVLKEVMSQQLAVLGHSPGQPKPAGPTPPVLPAAKPERFGPYRPLALGLSKSQAGFSGQQQKYLDALVRRYTARTPTAKAHAARWRRSYADCRASAGFRPSIKEMLYPIEAARAEGARIWDVDGNEYLDISMDFGVNIFGHKAPFIETALRAQIDRGLALSARSCHAGEVAALLCELTGMERAVFCQSGTESVMTAIRLARLATGRSRIAFFTGSYHGHFDGVLAVSSGSANDLTPIPAAPGIAPELIAGALVLSYGDEKSLEILRQQAPSLAAVLVEPIQSRHPDLVPAEFLKEVRKITAETGALLIFDEMISGFRMHMGGAQKLLGIEADLATYGKVLGGGQPIAAVAGRARYMNGIDGGLWNYGDGSFPEAEITFFAGTFAGNPLALASAHAVLLELRRRGHTFQEELTALTARFAERLNRWMETQEVPVRIVHCGSLFRFAFKGNLDLLFFHLMEKGVFVWEGRNCFLSAAHTTEDVEFLTTCIQKSILEMRRGGFLPDKAETAPESKAETPGFTEVPTTEAQRQLWVAARMDDLANHAYMESLVLRGRGRLDAEILQRAFQAVVDRHESLRTSFSDDGRRQMIHRTVTVDFRSVDGSGLLGSDLDRARETFMEELTGRAFDLRVAPLVRLGVFRLTADSQLIVISGHHIVFDGWSLNLFINDLAHCYTAQLGQIPTPEPPAAQFRDYAAWLEQKLQDPEMEVYEAFWRELLAGSLPDLNLPHDLPKPVRWSWRGARVSTRLSQSLRDRLAAVGRTYQATLFMTLLAAWQTFLHRFSGERDLVVGCPVLGRSMPQGMAIVGYLTHLLPIRTQLLPGESFAAFLERSRGLCLDAFENQDYPFSHMIRLFEGPSNPGEPALIRATFNLDRPREGPRFGGLQCEILTPEIRAAKFELSLNVMDLGGELLLEFDYNRDLFSAELAAVIRESFVAWLRQIAEEPARPQASLRLETEPVRTSPPARVLPAISAPTVDAAFAQRAAESPEAICLIAARASEPAGGARRLTYAELHMRASQVTARLHAAGVGLEDIVGLATNRGECRVIGLLGILQAGAAAFPLEASYPEARLRFMLEDCGASVVVCDPANEEHFAHLGYRTVVIGSEANQFPPSAATHHSADHLACIVYTSGSTGTPKGVAMTHANILSLLNAMAQRRDNPRGAVLHHSAFSFDAAIWEIWWPLLFGEPLVIAPPGELALGELAQCLREYQVRDAFFTTGLFNRLVDFEGETLAGLERIIVGGSTASARHFDALLQRNPKLCLLNVYGPTECTTFSTFHACSPVDASRGRIPIGTPLAGFRAEVLDPFFQPVPLHVPGELYLGGTSVARGYVNRPALTAERFLPDPAASEAGARLYRTGDRVRRLADGTLEFLGRFDHQVKVNGFRIELSEIEAALQDHPEIAQCLASVYEAGPGDHRLAVHIVAKGAAPDGGKVRKFLAARLPAYMVPMHVVVLPTLPLDANGKPDRRTLAVPELAASPSDAGAQSPPETPTEKQLAILWRRLLKREAIYRETDFFAAGGHSLLLAELVAEVAKELAVPVSLRDVYEHPTLAGCAQLLDSRREEGTLATAIPRVSRSARRGSRRSESRQPGLSEEP